MKPRLGVVLELRRSAEDEVRREVGRLERERLGLIAERDGHRAALQAAADGGAVPALREVLASYLVGMRNRILDDEARIATHDGIIVQARDRLALAHRDVKAIEAIRARDARADKLREQRREARDNDAFAGRMRQEAQV